MFKMQRGSINSREKILTDDPLGVKNVFTAIEREET